MKDEKKLKPFEQAWEEIRQHHLLGVLAQSYQEMVKMRGVEKTEELDFPLHSFGQLDIASVSSAFLYINKKARYKKEEWYFIYSVIMVIMGFDLYKSFYKKPEKNMETAIFLFAIDYVVNALNILSVSQCPEAWSDILKLKELMSFKNEMSIYEELNSNPPLADKLSRINLYNEPHLSIHYLKQYKNHSNRAEFSKVFTHNLVIQAQKTIELRGGYIPTKESEEKKNSESYKAKKWFVNHFPLLSALVSEFEIVEDIKVCQNYQISIAAVSAANKRIYINPLAQLNEQSMRFVIAHEILHIALNHASRLHGRDFLMWNLACDFVINHWLVEMNIGIAPEGIFMDRELANKSADEIYLMIAQDVRLKKKMGTLRDTEAGAGKNKNAGDMLDTDPRYFSSFEDASKEMLLRGMFLHESLGRGELPSSLVEEIKAINQPVIPWQVELARWIAERFPLDESRKTYARPSRRQSATPDIVRPRYVRPQDEKNTRTFGVIMDTSGSMDKELLGKCLGAIGSYCAAQEIKYIRLIFCDAAPYDEGYIPVELLSQKVKVKGRGGTIIQQAVNYLQIQKNFPENAPILILTDGFIEEDLKVQREHAFLVPNRYNLPFKPRGEVFEFK